MTALTEQQVSENLDLCVEVFAYVHEIYGDELIEPDDYYFICAVKYPEIDAIDYEVVANQYFLQKENKQ